MSAEGNPLITPEVNQEYYQPQYPVPQYQQQYYQQPQPFQHFITVPLSFIMAGCEYPIVIEGTEYAITIQAGAFENTEYKINEMNRVILKYEDDDVYKRNGNDLHGYFTYERQYVNANVNIPYIDGNNLEYTMDLEDNYEGAIENLGFYDPMTGERGRYIVHVSLN